MDLLRERDEMKKELQTIESDLRTLCTKIDEHVIKYDRKLNRNDNSYSYDLIQNLTDPISKEHEVEVRLLMEDRKLSLEKSMAVLKSRIEDLDWLDKYIMVPSFIDWIVGSGIAKDVKVRNVTSGRTLMNLCQVLKRRIVVKNPHGQTVHIFGNEYGNEVVLYAVANTIVDLDRNPTLLINKNRH